MGLRESVSILLSENIHKISPCGSPIIKVRLATYHKSIAVLGSFFFELSFELSFLQEIGSTEIPEQYRISGGGNYAILGESHVHTASVLSHMGGGSRSRIHRHGDCNRFEHD